LSSYAIPVASSAARSADSDRSHVSSDPSRTSGRVAKLERRGETERLIVAEDELEQKMNFVGDLRFSDEHVAIVLLELPHACET
jgi:hypothetical protein